jgi:hypothetical protein
VHYEQNLGDIGEPQKPSVRQKTPSCEVHDYEALWLRCALNEYAFYGDDANKELAKGLTEYIGEKVYEQENVLFQLYLKTDVAVQTVLDAIAYYRSLSKNVDAMMCKSLEQRISKLQSE